MNLMKEIHFDKKSKIVLILLIVLAIGVAIWFSAPAKQYRLQRRLNSEVSSLNIPSQYVLDQQSNFGDVLLSSPSGWGIQYWYSYSGDINDVHKDFVSILEKNDYRIEDMNNLIDINAFNEKDNVYIRVEINEKNKSYPVRITTKAIYP